MKKLILFALLIAMALIMLTGCGSSKQELNVYNWGEYLDPDIIDLFEEEYDITVNYREYPTNEELYVKLKSGSGDYDVIFPSDYMLEKLKKEDMLLR